MNENNNPNSFFGQENNNFEMPQLTPNNMMNGNQNTQVGQENIIEIPDEYYKKIQEEELAKKQAEIKKINDEQEIKNNQAASSKLIVLLIISALVIFGSLYATVNYYEYALVIIPIYIVLGSIIFAIKQKKYSDFPTSLLLGGMLVAIGTFVASMSDIENQDLWTYYAIAAGVSAIVGLVTSNIITKIFGDAKNLKGVHILGSLVYIAAIVMIPMYLYEKYPEEFYKYVFYKNSVIKAETEDEFVLKTLKNRYGIEFTCGSPKHYLDENKVKVTTRQCSDSNEITFAVKSTAYNESTIQYIVEETYFEKIYLNNLKTKIQEQLDATTGGKSTIYLYPKTGCSFVGDCYDSDDYNKIYTEEIKRENKYEKSSTYNFSKYLNITDTEFVNNYGFKYFIEISGTYTGMTSSHYETIITSTLSSLNSMGLENTSGYEIILKNTIDDLRLPVYKVIGEASSNGFDNPKVVDAE